jgi:hypothetical protein
MAKKYTGSAKVPQGGRAKLDDAFEDAAGKAIRDDPANDGQWFEATITVQVANPKINEYKVEITRP